MPYVFLSRVHSVQIYVLQNDYCRIYPGSIGNFKAVVSLGIFLFHFPGLGNARENVSMKVLKSGFVINVGGEEKHGM